MQTPTWHPDNDPAAPPRTPAGAGRTAGLGRAGRAQSGWGDAAVDGLLSGVAAGLLMAVFFLAAGALGGQGWAATLQQFDPGLTPTPLTGAVTHLAVSGVYGILFASLWRLMGRMWRRLPAGLAGL